MLAKHIWGPLGFGLLLAGVLGTAGVATAVEGGEGARLHAPQHHGGTDQLEPVPGQTTGAPRVPRQRLWCDLNGEHRGSGSRLPEVP
jgi:hypothetical protein